MMPSNASGYDGRSWNSDSARWASIARPARPASVPVIGIAAKMEKETPGWRDAALWRRTGWRPMVEAGGGWSRISATEERWVEAHPPQLHVLLLSPTAEETERAILHTKEEADQYRHPKPEAPDELRSCPRLSIPVGPLARARRQARRGRALEHGAPTTYRRCESVCILDARVSCGHTVSTIPLVVLVQLLFPHSDYASVTARTFSSSDR